MKTLRRLLPELAFPAVLAAFLAAYYAPAVFDGMLYRGEDLPAFFAFQSSLFRLAHQGGFSLWDPLPGLGISRLSNPQMGYFSPFSLWFYLVPTGRAMSFEPAFLLLALGVASYTFLRVSGLSRPCASFGSLGWISLGTVVDHVQHPDALECLFWLPIVLACWTRFAREGDGRWAAAAGVALAAMVFAGYPQYLIYSAILIAGWMLADLRRAGPTMRRRLALGAAGVVAAGVLIGLIQILPLTELVMHSQRTLLKATDFADQDRVTLSQLPYFAAAEAFLVVPRPRMGYYPLLSGLSLLVVGFAFYGCWRDRRLLAALGGAVLFMLGMLGNAGPVMACLQELPMASLMRAPVRMIVPAGFLLAWCAAWGMERATRQGRRRTLVGLVACLWLLGLWWALNHRRNHYTTVSAVTPPPAVTSLRKGRLALDYRSVPQLLINSGLVAGVPMLVVYNPVVPRNLFEALFASQVGSLRLRRKVMLAITIGNTIPINHPDLPLMRAFDLRRMVKKTPSGFVAQPVPAAGGRFFVVPRVRVVHSKAQYWALAAARSWDPTRVALVSHFVAPGTGLPGHVKVLKDRPDVRDLEVTGGGGLLVVSTLDYPGWHVSVDGRPVAPMQADLALLSVPVPPGAHRVVWRYRPAWLIPAMVGLGAGLLVLAGLWFGLQGSGDAAPTPR